MTAINTVILNQDDRSSEKGKQAVTVWLTGLSAAGKSTLAFALEQRLLAIGRACYVLDGDQVRRGLNRDLGFSLAARSENIRRIAEVARLMNDAGLIVISALISPMATDRAMAKNIVGAARFKEIYVSTPLAICEARDPKGLYTKARAGQIADFTGVSAGYEVPLNPDLILDTTEAILGEHVEAILQLL